MMMFISEKLKKENKNQCVFIYEGHKGIISFMTFVVEAGLWEKLSILVF